jgi:hypothetical protein
MVPVAGKLTACDTEVMAVIPSGPEGQSIPAASPLPARRVHAEVCEGYRMAADREARRRELVAYNRKKGL